MAEQLSQEESLALEQLIISRSNQIAAILHDLGRKRLIAKEELLEKEGEFSMMDNYPEIRC